MSLTPWGRVALAATLVSVSNIAQAEPKPATPAPAAAPAQSAKPAPGAAAAPSVPATPPAPATAAVNANADKSGVVLVEQAGRVAELGFVLNGDGRIVTALSRIQPGQPLSVRYASGTVENARVGHSDASRDLALLVPKTARVQKGLKAAEGPMPQGSAKLVGFTLAGNRVNAAPQSLQGLTEVNGHAVLKLGTSPKPNELGAPVVDERGDAAAIVVSGCAAGTAACTAAPVALPVNEVRAFLRTRPPSSGFQLPRLGIAGRAADTGVVRGLIITSVETQSPAAALGLRASEDPEAADVLVAVNGSPVVTEDALRGVLARHTAGDRVELLVFSKDTYKTLATRLGAPVQPVQAPPAPPSAPSAPKAPTATKAPAPPVAPIPPKAPAAPAAPPTHSK